MKEYRVVLGLSVEDLEEKVNAQTRIGYEPHGSLVIHQNGGMLLQPMVRDKKLFESKGRLGPG
jgi:hypothetical protein